MASEPMSQSESLKPCAHCGQKAWLRDDRPNDTWVECDNCQIGTAHGTFSEAIAAWNRRPSTADRGGEVEADWRDDPSADERWNAGLDYGQTQLCKVLGVDPASVSWDAATETLDGDVQSVIGNILTARFGDDWRIRSTRAVTTE